MVNVKAHIRAGRKVRAYTRGVASGNKLYGSRNKLITTKAGDLLSTTGVHNDNLFRAKVLFSANDPLGTTGIEKTFYKGVGVYKKFRGNPEEYVSGKTGNARIKKAIEANRVAEINEDMYNRYHSRLSKKKKLK